ncbi:ABC transporter permease [Georgenia sp. 311]|uniref:Transport permease protein n=1 Tax=Georgenia wutianyii TaxID=2585135 RepID=A0ABX5VMG3_9MICO|nr:MULTISPECIES: ABC transporter permease [Georgenia]QDB79684.1 ABC transporter permease [Georgenia wutianyii]TNC17032.1 ABC transporter permease [Georgenia sp. 311]
MSTTSIVRDTGNVLVRELWPVLRDPFSVIFSLLQPLVFLAFFGPLLSGTTGLPLAESFQWFVPGIIVMSTLFGTAMAGSNLLFELQSGSHERMLVTPVARPAFMVGRALKEMVPLSVQAVIITLVAAAFGFRPNVPGMALGLVLLAVLGIGLGALSYSLGIAARERDWMFWAVQQALIFPLMILSGMLLPMESAPRWMQVLGQVNPLTYVVGAERALFNGQLGEPAVWQGALAAVVLAALGLTLGIRMIRRSI